MNESAIFDAQAVAALLKCSERTVEDAARSGRLPAVKFGDGWLFPAAALIKAVNRIAEEDALKRAQPARPAAVRHQVATVKRTMRPNLSLL